jgi:hypothetical protein
MSKPTRQRNGEPLLRTAQNLRWNKISDGFAQDPFANSVSLLQATREGNREFDEGVIQERNARLQRDTHACTVDLGENVAREIATNVEVDGTVEPVDLIPRTVEPFQEG